MNLNQAEKYFLDRGGELAAMCKDGTPWVFLCASAFIEYLSRLVKGSDCSSDGYKDFVRDYLAKVRPGYATFTYANQKRDLPIQMYHMGVTETAAQGNGIGVENQLGSPTK